MATSALDTELTCSICLEFYRDPYQLPCMHSFCKQCLIEFSKPKITSENDEECPKGAPKLPTDKDEIHLECPECRQTVRLDQKGIDGLPKNFTLANIVQKYAKQEDKEEKKKYPCDICDTEPPNDAVKSCVQCGFLYCNSCLSQVHPSKGKLKTHTLVEPSEHGYSDSIRPEDSTLIDNLLLSVNNLDILKKKYERKIKDIQKNIDGLQDTGSQRKKETQMAFNRLSTMLKTKEQQCISEVDDEVDEKTDNLVLLLKSCQQFTEDINKLMKDAETCVEDFPRKTTRSDLQIIQSRISDLEKKQVNFHQQNLASASGLVDTHEVMEKLEALGQGTVSENKQKKGTLDVNVTLIPVRVGASISVTWKKVPGKDSYDISAECILPSGINEYFLYSGIQDSRYKIENLRPETVYKIRVAVQGEINIESIMVTTLTLKCIPCQPFVINGVCAHEITFVSEDSKTMMPENIANPHPSNYTRLCGTTGTMEISYGSQYWECKICFSFPRGMKTNDFVFDIGICQAIVVDRITDFFKNYGAYSAMAVKWGNKDIKLEFNREGKEVAGFEVDIEWQNRMELHLGYYIDIEKRTFSIIHVPENYILHSFVNIKTNSPYVPVFTHCDNDRRPYLDVRLLSGEDIQEIPSCLLKLLK